MTFSRPLAMLLCAAMLAAAAIAVPSAPAAPKGAVNQFKDGWPKITHLVLSNRDNSSRPIDGRPGRDPFGGTDPTYSCDGVHSDRWCAHRFVPCASGLGLCVTDRRGNNKLLGGHGNDTIKGGPWTDIIWADFHGIPSRTSTDRMWGNKGRDFIYGGHGWNSIHAGKGNDFVKVKFGRGFVDCGPHRDIVYTSRAIRRNKRYKFRNCEKVTTSHSPATQHRLRHGASRGGINLRPPGE
jgi:RTX calcium-binding nonapeptide repeat (4 copies)